MRAAPLPVTVSSADPVFAAIEAHRVTLAEFQAEAAFFLKKRRGHDQPEFRAARDAYEAATDALAAAGITTLPGLRAFTDYIADLRAYGRSEDWRMPYAIQVWHLSDAMANVSATLARVA
ncbi:hypothetical protein [Methylobacterium flocculans]|uniref:hypothetical protein n=1 Tax=Methylobacterium flocculans TaxID=2984843 RepID=UPI0021F38C7B|nr:hypothetical protein [Methylobacterium sp. FF17]